MTDETIKFAIIDILSTSIVKACIKTLDSTSISIRIPIHYGIETKVSAIIKAEVNKKYETD